MADNTPSIDWKTCAAALNRKLNCVASYLDDTCKHASLYDVAKYAESVIDAFSLHGEFDEPLSSSVGSLYSIQEKFEVIASLASRLRWCTNSQRLKLLDELQRVVGSASDEFAVFVAVIAPLKKELVK